ncbi:aldehyde dehydrogenase family protein [Amycolatopsis sp. DG1A-15b]|uniref:aldehyde dehydrogenase family protein n=1 Tax=Amycolatopsis sp. DG1A-15b TaxID=3052846 RepID=UPI00255B86C3|nr:aldehyde dehydrogenase family protein [Amycolatopsis sp. DG1A-15b]WIX92408.1 aldehyde dehydrogenase family protein [Amycolatopsis sp. DG1A-15b]
MTGETFDVLNPATGELVGTHRVTTEYEVTDAVRQARDAAVWWAGLGFGERARRLDSWRRRIARGAAELADLISREMGKPRRVTPDGLGRTPHFEHLVRRDVPPGRGPLI